MVIVLSGNRAQADPTTLPMLLNCTKTFLVRVFDQFGNPMAAGTTLSITNAHVFDSTVRAGTVAECGGFSPPTCTVPDPQEATVTVEPTSVLNTNAAGGTYHYIQVAGPEPLCRAPVYGTFNLSVKTPSVSSNTNTIIPFTVLGDK